MSKEVKRLKLANYFVWGLLFIWVFTLAVWFYPRQTVQVLDYQTTQDKYRVGEELFVTTKSEVFFNGVSNYDVRLLCDGGRYLLKSFEVTSTPTIHQPTRTSVGIVPVIPTPDNCVVRTQATHTIQVLPYLTRTYTNQWETNRFLVEAERE